MTISDPQFVTILVFVIAGLFLLQTLFLLVFLDQVNRQIRKADLSLIRISRKTTKGLRDTKEELQKLSQITDKLPAMARRVDTVLGIATEKARWTNDVASRNIQLSTDYLEEANRKIEFALSQFTRQTSKVKRLIRYPANYVSAIIHGAFTGFRTYTRETHRGQPATHYPDDEIFI
jgi:hypothetical protein